MLLVTLAAMALLPVLPSHARADTFGIRAGSSLDRFGFSSAEVYWQRQLALTWGDSRSWHTDSQLELRGGRINGGGDSLTVAGAAFNLWLRHPNAPISLGVGTGPTYLSKSRLAGRDFGGHWQFTTHIAAQLRLGANLQLGYRIQHTSNAGLRSPNYGYNLHVLDVQVRF